MKALVATSALGMGFDTPDLGFDEVVSIGRGDVSRSGHAWYAMVLLGRSTAWPSR